MSLPVINTPKYELILPSSGEIVSFRPFLVKEKKILMIAQKGSESEQFQGIIDIIKACFEGVDVSSLPSFDVEYMFLKLRTKSIGEISKLSYNCQNVIDEENGVKCNNRIDFEINLDDIGIVGEPEKSKLLEVGDNVQLLLKYPCFSDIRKIMDAKTEDKQVISILKSSIESIISGDEVFSLKDQTEEEVINFLDSLPLSIIMDVQKFIENAPKLKKSVNIGCEKCGHKDDIEIEGLLNFF